MVTKRVLVFLLGLFCAAAVANPPNVLPTPLPPPSKLTTYLDLSTNVVALGAKRNAIYKTDGVMAASSNTITSASTTFVAADVGKYIVVTGAGSGGATLATTIIGVSGNTAMLAASSTNATPSYAVTSNPPVVATIQSGAGNYVPGDTITLAGGTGTAAVFTVATTQVASATVNAGGSGCTNGTQTVTGTTGVAPSGQTSFFTASVTVSGNAITAVNSITYGGIYGTNPTSLTAEPVTGASCTGATLTLKMGPLNVWASTPGSYSVKPSDPVAQASTSGSGTGATFTLAAAWMNTGKFVYGNDDSAYFAQALTTAGTTCTNVYVPAGQYMIASAQTLTANSYINNCNPTLIGDGAGASVMFEAASMGSLFNRPTTFGVGGGIRGVTIDGMGLGNYGISIYGGTMVRVEYVEARNFLISDFLCGDGTDSTYGNFFENLYGYTDQNTFLPSQRSTYNIEMANGCTDSEIGGKSSFANASAANLYFVPNGDNTDFGSHPFGYPETEYYANYGIRVDGNAILENEEYDGALIAALFINGFNTTATGGALLFNANSQGTADGVLIASGSSDDTVTSIATAGSGGVPAANRVVQQGTASTSTVVANNPGATYTSPVIAPAGSSSNAGIQINGTTSGFFQSGSNIFAEYIGGFAFSFNNIGLAFSGNETDHVRSPSSASSVSGATNDQVLCVTTSSLATAVSLPSAFTGLTFEVDDCTGSAATHNITITPASGNIDGSANYVISTNYGVWRGRYTGSLWKTVYSH